MSHLIRIYAITPEGERQPVYCDGLVLQFSCGSELELFGSASDLRRKGVVLRSSQRISPVEDEPRPELAPPSIGIHALAHNTLNVFVECHAPAVSTARFSSVSRAATAPGTSNKRL